MAWIREEKETFHLEKAFAEWSRVWVVGTGPQLGERSPVSKLGLNFEDRRAKSVACGWMEDGENADLIENRLVWLR